MIDEKTKAAATASVAGLTVPGAAALPELKSAKAASVLKVVVPLVLMALPTIATFVPQITPFIGGINALAGWFGYGA